MGRIQVDFDALMKFADTYGDLGRDVDARRAVFRMDAARLDGIVASYGLPLVTSSRHFAGRSISGSMGDADARAGRVAQSLVDASSRLFRHAGSVNSDTHFNWVTAALGPIDLRSLFDSGAMGWIEGQLVTALRVGSKFRVLGPIGWGIDGVFLLYGGIQSILDPIDGGWSIASGVSEVIGGGLYTVATVVFIATAVSAGVVTAFAASAPVALAASAFAVLAIAINHREELGELARFLGDLVRPAVQGVTETGHNLLSGGASGLWSLPRVVFPPIGLAAIALSGAEAAHDLLQPARDVPLVSHTATTSRDIPLGTVRAGALQGGATVDQLQPQVLNVIQGSHPNGSPSSTPVPQPAESFGATTGLTGTRNTFYEGYCTWGAALKFHESTGLWPGWSGDAKDWAGHAEEAGWTVQPIPAARSIVVVQPHEGTSSSDGHVAWVDRVEQRADGTYLHITEMNGQSAGFNAFGTRELKVQGSMRFILAP